MKSFPKPEPPPKAAAGLQAMAKPVPHDQILKVKVVRGLSVSWPFKTQQACGQLIKLEFPPSMSGVFTKDLRAKCIEENVEGAAEASLVVLQVWKGFAHAVTRPHFLGSMDCLRDYGDEPLHVQLIPGNSARCCCGQFGCKSRDINCTTCS